MSELVKYGVSKLFRVPLIEDGDADFESAFVSAVGDTKLFSDAQVATNLTSFILGFVFLSELPAAVVAVATVGVTVSSVCVSVATVGITVSDVGVAVACIAIAIQA